MKITEEETQFLSPSFATATGNFSSGHPAPSFGLENKQMRLRVCFPMQTGAAETGGLQTVGAADSLRFMVFMLPESSWKNLS